MKILKPKNSFTKAKSKEHTKENLKTAPDIRNVVTDNQFG